MPINNPAGAIPSVGHYPMGAPRPKEILGVGKDVEVVAPQDTRMRFIIDTMALYVLRDGCEFEQLVMAERQGDPEFSFLFDLDSPDHVYYRWRVYSLAEGDTLRTWRMDPFQMVEGGQRWLPPAMLAVEAVKREAGDRALSDHERDKWEDILRGLTAERAAIRAGMVFALDHAEAAAEVVEVLQVSGAA
ncbi:U2-associated protein [Monoraphidium neglectum]|uniref:U2-associated protein n=1 Tax=Monoraphidium neglectum TaxID=145388 RepID=A0A0D2LK86_9CHLO|nr:U2-associated protein [Monoraphidium neglectum]KIY92374.1 U2-associated protein [Monoraphidium neglectum]|eukprot:XP_013891394.1 U2-associated protein [Monoraphidium neglectum]